MIKKLTIDEVKYTAHSLAKKFMDWDEPIPGFSTRFPNKLESCIATPFMTYSKKSLYRGLEKKAAILFYLLIKNHPFQNGNKRIAVMSLLYFLYKNSKWLSMSNIDLYNFAKGVAKSKPQKREKVMFEIQEMIQKHITDWKD